MILRQSGAELRTVAHTRMTDKAQHSYQSYPHTRTHSTHTHAHTHTAASALGSRYHCSTVCGGARVVVIVGARAGPVTTSRTWKQCAARGRGPIGFRRVRRRRRVPLRSLGLRAPVRGDCAGGSGARCRRSCWPPRLDRRWLGDAEGIIKRHMERNTVR